MVLFKKIKTADNTTEVIIDNGEFNDALLIPRKTTAERDTLSNPRNGLIIYNETTNQQEGYINGSWQPINTGVSVGGNMDLGSAQVVVGTKTFLAPTVGDFDTVILRSDFTGVGSGAEVGIQFTQPNLASGPRNRSIFVDGNTNDVNLNGDLSFYDNDRAVPYVTFHSQAGNNFMNMPDGGQFRVSGSPVLTTSSILPNSTDSIINNNLRLNATGLRIGDTGIPTSLLHLNSANPTLTLSGATSTLAMNGSSSNIIDMGFNNVDINMQTATGHLDIRASSLQFVRFDSINSSVSFGPSASTKPKIRAVFTSGPNEDHAIAIPRLSAAGEISFINTVGVDPTYNGSIWYNSSVSEFFGLWNNVPYTFVHRGSSSGTQLNALAIHDGSVSNTNYGHLANTTADIQSQLNTKLTPSDPAVLILKSIDANFNTLTNIKDSAISAIANIDVTKLGTGIIDNTEFNYLNGVTSDIQTQLNGKVSISTNETITGLKTFNNEIHMDNSSFLRLRTDALGTNPHIHGISYSAVSGECVCIATSDAAVQTRVAMGYWTGDNKANAWVEKAAFAYTNVAGSAVLRLNNIAVVGAQQPAVADSTGTGDIVAQFNILLERIRSHGLIAT